MNKLGSMEWTPTTKSVLQINLRQICQWTAATSLVAAGSVALFSANTLEKLSQNGEVSIDLAAFTKLASTSLALERIDDQKLLAEEDRIIEKSLFAQAEALPKAHTDFKRVGLARVAIVHREEGLTALEAREIAQLERAVDPAIESEAMVGMYRRVRFKFLAAADRIESPEHLNAIAAVETAPDKLIESLYPVDSVEIAQTTEAREFDEIPVFDASDFQIIDEVETSASAAVSSLASITAKSEVMEPVFKGETPAIESAPVYPDPIVAKVITIPGIDLIPEFDESQKVTSQAPTQVSSQKNEVKAATGPPEPSSVSKTSENHTLHAVGSPSIESAPEISPAVANLPVTSTTLTSSSSSVDLVTPKEYSADVASIYDMHPDEASGESDEYSKDAGYSARPKPAETVTTANYGSGISKDPKGITIAWSEKNSRNSKIFVGRPGETPAAIQPEPTNSEFAKSLAKFSFESAALQGASPSEGVPAVAPTIKDKETSTPAEIDLNRCDTARFGVEAFNPGVEKESLSICLRTLSHEGGREGQQARWREAYGTEKEHWPTLTLLRDSQLSNLNRIPMLSNASIRILSAISKTNTHTGTGILFGEIPSGLEIQLIGRSDSPIYLDAGLKVSDSNADLSTLRQFVFLNVQPGQPLLSVKDTRGRTGALPLVVKAGIATYLKVPEPKVMDLSFTLFDASSRTEKRLSGFTGEIVGQPGKIGISDSHGYIKISKAVVLGDYPLYFDLLENEKGYKNRYRIRPEDRDLKTGAIPLFFFNEKRVATWLKQLAGGVSPYSGLIVGALPQDSLAEKKGTPKNSKMNRALRIGTLEKKSALVPERYVLSMDDQLVIKHALTPVDSRFIGVQIPEGAAIPSLIDENGALLWSEIVYAQPGVINVVGP